MLSLSVPWGHGSFEEQNSFKRRGWLFPFGSLSKSEGDFGKYVITSQLCGIVINDFVSSW